MVPLLSQMNSVHTYFSISLKSILTSSSHLSLGLQRGLFPSGFPTKILYVFLISPMRAICISIHNLNYYGLGIC